MNNVKVVHTKDTKMTSKNFTEYIYIYIYIYTDIYALNLFIEHSGEH